MGKPSPSCLKIIACGSDSAVEDDIEAPEAKGSGEKRGWSFRKRSARHRVLSNSVTSENLTLGDKEIPQPTNIQSQTPVDTAVAEKVVALEQHDEKLWTTASVELKPPKSIEPELSETLDAPKPPKSDQLEVSDTSQAPKPPELVEPEVPEMVDTSKSCDLVESKTHETLSASESLNLVEPRVSEVVATSALEPSTPAGSKIDGVVAPESPTLIETNLSKTVFVSQDEILEEPIITHMQTGSGRSLDEKELLKLRRIVKLQAAIRGHLVRRCAVDTLHCMQGIVKVQSLVRANHSKLLGDEVSVAKPIASQSSTEKLLRNGFARQLMESTPKSKSTVIKCDALKPNSAWTWLERWMALSSSGVADLEKLEIRTEDRQFQAEIVSPSIQSEIVSKVKSVKPEFAVEEVTKTFENEKSSISCAPAEESQASNILHSKQKEQSYENNDASPGERLGGSTLKNQNIESESHSQKQSGSLSNNLAVETEECKLSMKRMASEQVDVESKKLAYGSRKASNPAFIAAHSKFEELSSSSNYSRSLSSRHLDASAGQYTASSLEARDLKEKEPSGAEALIPSESRVNIGGSECGTELSVTSALDSPDQSEAEVAEVELEVKHREERANNPISNESLDINVNGRSGVYASNSSSSPLVQKDLHESNGVYMSALAADSHQPDHKPKAIASDEHYNGEYVHLDTAADSQQVEQKPEESACDVQAEAGPLTEQPAYKFSPEASPNNSHMTISEPQGTPSSQVSVKAKRSKVDKSASFTKRSSLSAGKRTPAKLLHDSGVSSGEQLSKDQKRGTRRNSFELTKPDNIDQDPRDSTSSTKALPSYMQATESARAKAHSPRSSPDVQDKDMYIAKKRHSLPGADRAGGRQGSPRVQAPHVQAGKGNTNTPPQERRWVR